MFAKKTKFYNLNVYGIIRYKVYTSNYGKALQEINITTNKNTYEV